MNRIVIVLMVLALSGCTYTGQDPVKYLEEPQTIIQDPHFTQYKGKRDALESQYLNKEITYAEYVEQTKALDDQYNQEVEKREEIISSPY